MHPDSIIPPRLCARKQVPDEAHLTPAAVLAAPPASLRACGLSERKASYLTDLAAHFNDGRLSDDLLTSEYRRASGCACTHLLGGGQLCHQVRP